VPFPAAPATPLSGRALGKAAAGAAGDGHRNGAPPRWPSRIPRPKPRRWVAGDGGGRRNGPPVPSPPKGANGDDDDDGARAAAHGDASSGDPLRNDDAAAAAVLGKVGNVGQVNGNCGGNNGDNNEDDNKWGRGA
jgi:hypothetical protein